MNAGKDLSTVSLNDVLPADLSNTTKEIHRLVIYFMLGTSVENAPISRFIDNKNNKKPQYPCGKVIQSAHHRGGYRPRISHGRSHL